MFNKDDAKRIGKKLNLDWNKIDIDEFTMGLNVELEHGTRYKDANVSNDDPVITGKIALAHLYELPDYYTRLEKMEEEGKKELKKIKESVNPLQMLIDSLGD